MEPAHKTSKHYVHKYTKTIKNMDHKDEDEDLGPRSTNGIHKIKLSIKIMREDILNLNGKTAGA